MAKTLTYPSTRRTTLGARLKIAVLPLNSRILATYTLTLTRAFNSNTDPGIIYVSSNQPVYLTAETVLIFNGITVTIAEDAYINTSETILSILDIASGFSAPLGSTFTYNGLLLVYGCKTCNISPEIQTIETTNVSHGIDKEEKQTFFSKKLSLEIVEIYGDIGGYVLYAMTENPIYRNYEFFFDYSFPDGSYKRGAAIITNASYTTNNQSIKNFRIEARIQPNTYTFLNT